MTFSWQITKSWIIHDCENSNMKFRNAALTTNWNKFKAEELKY